MQTFIPTPDHLTTARVLDRQRLGKQRVESWQILRTLVGDSDGWRNHPAVRMWRGHERFLCNYTTDLIMEWRGRGYRDSRYPLIVELRERFPEMSSEPPSWWGRADVHESHVAMLLRKKYDHYAVALHISPATGQRLMGQYEDYVWPI